MAMPPMRRCFSVGELICALVAGRTRTCRGDSVEHYAWGGLLGAASFEGSRSYDAHFACSSIP